MAVVNQTKIGTDSKATLGKLPGDVLERILMGFPKALNIYLLELNRSQSSEFCPNLSLNSHALNSSA